MDSQNKNDKDKKNQTIKGKEFNGNREVDEEIDDAEVEKEDDAKLAEDNSNYEEYKFELEDDEEDDEEEVLEEIERLQREKLRHREALRRLKFELEDLNESGLELVRTIGMDNYRKLVERYGGTSIYLQQHDNLIERKRKQYVYNIYLANDSDIKKTTAIFGLSESTVRRYVRDTRKYLLNKKLKERKKKN